MSFQKKKRALIAAAAAIAILATAMYIVDFVK